MSKKISILNLPINRKQQYKFVMKSQFSLIFKLSLLTLIFILPLCAQIIAPLILISPLLVNISDYQEALVSIFNAIKVSSLFIPFTMVITTLAICGVSNVFKKIIYNEGFLLFRDFKQGLKNGAKSLITSFIYGIIISLIIISLFSININSNITFFLIALIFAVIFIIVIVNMAYLSINIHLYYECSVIKSIKDAFILTFTSFGTYMLTYLTFLPLIICFLIDFFVFSRFTFLTLTALFVYVIFLFTHNTLICQLHIVSKFDNYINKNQYPDYFEKGLFKYEENN